MCCAFKYDVLFTLIGTAHGNGGKMGLVSSALLSWLVALCGMLWALEQREGSTYSRHIMSEAKACSPSPILPVEEKQGVVASAFLPLTLI
jgi:hypothetical protein